MRHRNSNKNKKYENTIGLVSHLILTKPIAVRKLLTRYGIVFSPAPTREQLIAQVVETLAEGNPSFNHSLSRLLAIHIKRKGRDMLALERNWNIPRSHNREDEFLGGLVGGLAKNLVSGLFKKKKNKSSSGSTGGSQAAEVEKMKVDMQRQMLELEKQRREEQERRRQREEESRKRREEQDKKKQKRLVSGLLIGGGVVVTLVIGGIIIARVRPKPISKAA